MITQIPVPTDPTTTALQGGTPSPVHRRPSARLAGAGAGALLFAGSVVFQNILRGGSAPANDASASEVLAHYASHRGVTFVLVASFVAGALGLITFLAGVRDRVMAGGRPVAATAGFLGAGLVLALFPLLVATEEALTVVARGPAPDTGAVTALWAFHNSVFTVLWLFIAVALFGLGRAGVAAGVTPRVFDRLAPLGAALLAGACLAGPAIAAGEAMPLFGVALAGFVLWLAFLAATGVRLVRSSVAGSALESGVRS